MSDTSISKQEEGKRALSREWLVARIVIIGGIVVAIVALAYFGWLRPTMLQREATARAQQRAHENVEVATQFCRSGLAAAQTFGVVPPYAQLFGHNIYRTNVQGRYVCVAATHLTRYLLVADLYCRALKDRRCVSLFSVTQANGTVLYQRQS